MTARLEGLIAATHTPFDADGRLDTSRVPAQADHLAATGVAGVFIGGSTGEGLSLSVDERRALAEAWAGVLDGRMRFVVHAGHNALADAVAYLVCAGKLVSAVHLSSTR